MGVMMKMMMQGVGMQRGEKGGGNVKMLAATPAVIRRKKEVRSLRAFTGTGTQVQKEAATSNARSHQAEGRGAQFTCFTAGARKRCAVYLLLLVRKYKY
jgi:hypothetical protein